MLNLLSNYLLALDLLDFSNDTEVKVLLDGFGDTRPLVFVESSSNIIGELLLPDYNRVVKVTRGVNA